MRIDILLQGTTDVIATFDGLLPSVDENICVSVTKDDKTVRKWYRVRERDWRVDSTEMDFLGKPMCDNHVNLYVTELTGKEWK